MKFIQGWKKQDGQSMTEYILVLALVALVAIAGVKLFGSKLGKLFSDKAAALEQEVNSTDANSGQ